jgi:hypothetical protein
MSGTFEVGIFLFKSVDIILKWWYNKSYKTNMNTMIAEGEKAYESINQGKICDTINA